MAKTSQVDRALAEIDRQIAEVKAENNLRLLSLEAARRVLLDAAEPQSVKKPRKPRTMKPKQVAEVA